MAGMTMRVRSVEETMPPIIGTAMRCMSSEPVPVLHMIGSSPAMMATTVIIFGRTRSMEVHHMRGRERTSNQHSWNGQASGIRPLPKKPSYCSGRHVSLDHIAPDFCSMAGSQVARYSETFANAFKVGGLVDGGDESLG